MRKPATSRRLLPRRTATRAAVSALFVSLGLAGCTAGNVRPPEAGSTAETRATPVDGELVRYSFVAFRETQRIEARRFDSLPGTTARVLGADPEVGRVAAVVDVPAGYASADDVDFRESFEFYVLDGDVRFGPDALVAGDFAFVPSGVRMPVLASPRGARLLAFHDPSTADAEALAKQQARGPYVTRGAEARWSPGTVSQAAGVDVPLEIKHLKKDPWTGARTWLVRMKGGVQVPWERHSVPEEGYLLAGDYRLVECLPDGAFVGTYRPGGYFYRPGGLLHSGPESGTRRGATWLMRSPAELDVQFYTECRDGLGEGALGTPSAAASAPTDAPAAPGAPAPANEPGP